jgi:hypothetical protein
MESRFGTELSQVRIHANAQSSAAAEELNANAFTYGQDIFFGAGNYRPNTSEGNRLLAHEITHTLQQGTEGSSAAHASPQSDYQVSHHNDPEEREARDVADRIAQGQSVSTTGNQRQLFRNASPGTIRRDDPPAGLVVDAISGGTTADVARLESFANFFPGRPGRAGFVRGT